MRRIALACAPVLVLTLAGCPDPDGCVDEDADGFCESCDGAPGCQVDCDDSDAWTYPGAPELYVDGLDANCDGVDGPVQEICGNGIDDDNNGATDCDDAVCAGSCRGTRQAMCTSAVDISVAGRHAISFEGALNSASACGGRERMLRFSANVPGELTLQVEDGIYFAGVITDCINESPACQTARSSAPFGIAVNPGTTYIMLEETTPSTLVALTTEFLPYVCGDGIIAGGEECDDGNVDLGDGCDNDCFIEALFGVCQAAPELAVGITPLHTGSTDALYGSCSELNDPERVFAYHPDQGGTLHVALATNGIGTLFAKSICTTELVGEEGCAATEAATAVLHLTATPGVPLYIFAEGQFDEEAELTTFFTAH